MSVKELEALPVEIQKPKTIRKMIRDDLEYALSQKMHTFEIEGDYNYKYLANYVREEADKIFHQRVFIEARRKVIDKLKDEFGIKYVFTPDYWEYRGEFIKVFQRKESDRIHVYAVVNYKYAERFAEILERDTRMKYRMSNVLHSNTTVLGEVEHD